ncbi:ABC transporter ATP-binding protein|uniref:Energy-coupling factor transport system ATP-binding protein n=1 Tax=Dendrosporobacter quercicolus TaxID=146817 RepID=A0A1G9NP99_9FIRM|nr:ABC transporter ATP-binding protein [Dendrosporobacter quercicolus]NSL47410.1 ABC transporter ATP-binding protein [Dendrosporobacter quercicolus DSM 1736]SDL88416.1 energy-coupling factor transport system ATP-binding protein [Dendrosporobacter quercicolus]
MKLEGISFWYEGQKKATLQNINLEIQKGEFVLLCGGSGCGKTALTRVLNGLCPEFYPGKLAGKYTFGGENMTSLPIREKSLRIGSVFQDPETQFFTTKGHDEIVLGAEQRALPPGLILEKLAELNRLLQLEGLYEKSLFTMSAGEKQKIAVASVCMLSPEVLVLDEPSANLDPASILKLGEILTELKGLGVTIILSEHRFHYVKESFDRAIYMVDGELHTAFTRAEILALGEETLLRMGLRSFEAPMLQLNYDSPTEDGIFCEGKNLCFVYKGSSIFNGLNLKIPNAKVTAILGENGRGKTTLLRIIAGLHKPASGEIFFGGKALSKGGRIRQSFLLEQNGNNQLFSNQVEKEFLIDVPGQNSEKIYGVLAKLDLLQKKHAHPLSLSGGQKQRLLVGISALSGKQLLLLDEPTSGLDAMNMHRISTLLRHNAAKGQTIVVVTHDIEFINKTADFIIQL